MRHRPTEAKASLDRRLTTRSYANCLIHSQDTQARTNAEKICPDHVKVGVLDMHRGDQESKGANEEADPSLEEAGAQPGCLRSSGRIYGFDQVTPIQELFLGSSQHWISLLETAKTYLLKMDTL